MSSIISDQKFPGLQILVDSEGCALRVIGPLAMLHEWRKTLSDETDQKLFGKWEALKRGDSGGNDGSVNK